jgi:hypothetical protein
MALVRFGSVVQAASGALGAVTFSRHAGASIVRTRPIFKPHQSAAVLANQAVFAQARAAWRALSTEDRLTWIRAAPQFPETNRLGFSRPLPAFTIFMRLAIRNILLGFTPPTYPYAFGNADLGHEVSIEIFPGGPANLINPPPHIVQGPRHTTKAQRLFSTHPGLPGQLWLTISHEEPDRYSLNLWTPLIAAFGTPQRLEWYRFEVTQWLTGWPRSITSRHLLQIPNVGNELTYNGDFQIGGTPPAGWTVTGTGALTQSHTGTWGDGESGRWVVAAAQPLTYFATAVANRFTWVPSTAYTFRMAYKGISGLISSIKVGAAGAAEVTLYTNLAATASVWTTTTKSFTSPTLANGGYIYFYQNAAQACDFSFDNLSIRKDVY